MAEMKRRPLKRRPPRCKIGARNARYEGKAKEPTRRRRYEGRKAKMQNRRGPPERRPLQMQTNRNAPV
jgi:hypothetical protein